MLPKVGPTSLELGGETHPIIADTMAVIETFTAGKKSILDDLAAEVAKAEDRARQRIAALSDQTNKTLRYIASGVPADG